MWISIHDYFLKILFVANFNLEKWFSLVLLFAVIRTSKLSISLNYVLNLLCIICSCMGSGLYFPIRVQQVHVFFSKMVPHVWQYSVVRTT